MKKGKGFIFIGFSNKYEAFIPEYFDLDLIESIKQISYNDFMKMIDKKEIEKAFYNPGVLKNKSYKFFSGYFDSRRVIICKNIKDKRETYFIEKTKGGAK